MEQAGAFTVWAEPAWSPLWSWLGEKKSRNLEGLRAAILDNAVKAWVLQNESDQKKFAILVLDRDKALFWPRRLSSLRDCLQLEMTLDVVIVGQGQLDRGRWCMSFAQGLGPDWWSHQQTNYHTASNCCCPTMPVHVACFNDGIRYGCCR